MNHGKGSRTEGAAGRMILSDSRTEMIVSFFRVTEGCAGGHVQWGPRDILGGAVQPPSPHGKSDTM